MRQKTVITKSDRSLLQSASDIAMGISYYNVWQAVITKCIRYYKARNLWQNET